MRLPDEKPGHRRRQFVRCQTRGVLNTQRIRIAVDYGHRLPPAQAAIAARPSAKVTARRGRTNPGVFPDMVNEAGGRTASLVYIAARSDTDGFTQGDQLSKTASFGLCRDLGAVILDRLRAQLQLGGDGLVGKPLDKQLEDLTLAGRET